MSHSFRPSDPIPSAADAAASPHPLKSRPPGMESEIERALALADQALHATDPTAFPVSPRLVKRVITQDRGLTGLGLHLVHRKSWLISGDRLQRMADPEELGLASFDQLPNTVLLIARPDADELPQLNADQLLLRYWRMLFHSRVHLALESRLTDRHLTVSRIRERIDRIGQVQFDEIQSVLEREHYIDREMSRTQVYFEFAAVYLELKYFSPDWLATYFPSLAELPLIDHLLAEDIDAPRLLEQTRLDRLPANPLLVETVPPLSASDWWEAAEQRPISRLSARSLQAQLNYAERLSAQGNTVRAARISLEAARRAAPDQASLAAESAREQIHRLTTRLQVALAFNEDVRPAWEDCLTSLLGVSRRGFWNSDARLLYDLQKVCIDYERDVAVVDGFGWLISFGRRPLRRFLPHQRDVLICRDLRSAIRRLETSLLTGPIRRQLVDLLHEAAAANEERLREKFRPTIDATLRAADLTPTSLPERVAFRKIREDLLDLVADHGFFTLGQLRDAISRNQLKFPDVARADVVWQGDPLLQMDRQFSSVLDGVYHHGEAYLRWLQTFTALLFGTVTGRFLFQFIMLPFGSAYVILVGLEHMWELIAPYVIAAPDTDQIESATLAASEHSSPATHTAASATPDVVTTPSEQALAQSDPSAASPPTALENAEPVQNAEPVETPSSVDSPQADQVAQAEPITTNDPAATTGPVTNGNPAASTSPAARTSSDPEQIALTQSHGGHRDGHPAAHAHGLDHSLFYVALLGLGTFILLLLHLPAFRQLLGRFLFAYYKYIRLALYDLPARLLRLAGVRAFLRSTAVVIFRRYFFTPLLLTLIAWIPLSRLSVLNTHRLLSVTVIFALFNLAVNSRIGRRIEEASAELFDRTWYTVRVRIFVTLIDWIMDLFKRMLEWVERILYAVDEWLRFRSGESQLTLIIKAIAKLFWSPLAYSIRFAFNLIIEPTVNPIKHFPVVTAAGKVLTPVQFVLANLLIPAMGVYWANVLALTAIVSAAGICGFLVWEFKENWRLFAANRPKNLQPELVGAHGETIIRFMRPGFHSGTLPKIYARLRQAHRRVDPDRRRNELNKYRERLHHSEEEIRRFVERELVVLLDEVPAWRPIVVEIGHIHLASNSLQIELLSPTLSDRAVWMALQEQSGWVVASLLNSGWLLELDFTRQRILERALSGFYKKCGVDFVREQIDAAFDHRPLPYDIGLDELTVWPGDHFEHEVHYALTDTRIFWPRPARLADRFNLPTLEAHEVMFSRQQISWIDWVARWKQIESLSPTDSVHQSLSLLPSLDRLPIA